MSEREDKTISYYNEHAADFQNSVSTANMNSMCDRFLSYLSKPAHILDLGCGTGRDSLYFLDHGYTVLPMDASEAMCKIASKITGLTVRQLRFENLDYTDEFDGVWACASLLHVEREKLPAILRKINKALKPGGILYMSFKYGETTRKKEGRLFTDMTEKDLFFLCNESNGFELEDYYITADVRLERSDEKWLNIIAKKMNDNN